MLSYTGSRPLAPIFSVSEIEIVDAGFGFKIQTADGAHVLDKLSHLCVETHSHIFEIARLGVDILRPVDAFMDLVDCNLTQVAVIEHGIVQVKPAHVGAESATAVLFSRPEETQYANFLAFLPGSRCVTKVGLSSEFG